MTSASLEGWGWGWGGSGCAPGGASALADLLTMPEETDRDVTLEYVDATTRRVWTPIQHEYWLRWQLEPVETECWIHTQAAMYSVVQPIPHTDSGITYGGVGWNSYSNPACLNGVGSTHTGSGVGLTATFTVTEVERIYLVLTHHNNGGYGSVTINGGTDLVNELSLVGSIRRVDCYEASAVCNNRVLIATGLNPTSSYTVVLTSLGTADPASSGTRIYFEGYGTRATTINDTDVLTGNARKSLSWAIGGGNEYVAAYCPTGADPISYPFSGGGHGNENWAAITWKDGEGNDISVGAETPYNNAASVVVEQAGTTRHPATGETDHANIVLQHTFNTAGMDIYHKHTWLTAGILRSAYTALWQLAYVDEGYVGENSGGEAFSLEGSDNIFWGNAPSQIVLAWDDTYPYVSWIYMPDLVGVNNWLKSAPDYARIWDQQNKIYIMRVATSNSITEQITVDGVWESTAQYRVSYHEDVTSLP